MSARSSALARLPTRTTRGVFARPVLLALLALAAAGCEPAVRPDLEIASAGWSRLNWGVRAVSGFVRNNSALPYDSVRVTIETFDAKGRRIGVVTTDVGEINAYKLRAFDTPYLPGPPARFRVRAITGHSQAESVHSPRWGEPPAVATTGRPSNR